MASTSWENAHSQYWVTQDDDVRRQSAAVEKQWFQLLKTAFPHARPRVEQSIQNWNQKVREQLRNETGFRLYDGERPVTVPVKVADGLPIALIDTLAGPTGLIGHLLLHQGDYQRAMRGVDLTRDYIYDIIDLVHGAVPTDQDRHSVEFVQTLLAALNVRLAEVELSKRILSLNQDVLGAYFFRKPEVRVFWMPIAIVSASSGMDIESLTVVVLSHELAHAYSHLGRDINLADWDTEDFANSSLEEVEGIAQYYTEQVCTNIFARLPGALKCFDEMKELQAQPYRAYENWPEAANPEHLRQRVRGVSKRDQKPAARSEVIVDADWP